MSNQGDSGDPILAPHSVEAEEAVLGSVIINPDALYEIGDILIPADFFIVANGWTWEAIMTIFKRGDNVDTLTVIGELREKRPEDFANMGGSAFITKLVNNTPTHVHAMTYARMVERTAVRRRLLHASAQIAGYAMESNSELSQIISASEQTLYSVIDRQAGGTAKSIGRLANEYFERIEGLYNVQEESGTSVTLGIPTGFSELDTLLSGLQAENVYIIAARPSVGKTALALQMAAFGAERNISTLFLSMEMSAELLVNRLIGARQNINTQALQAGRLDSERWNRFVTAVGDVQDWPLIIDDASTVTLHGLRMKLLKWKRQAGIQVCYVDYLQLINGPKDDGRVSEVSAISRELKILAKELHIPIVALAQLSRAVEQRSDKRPKLSDLRESGGIEQDADVVAFIYRADMYGDVTRSGLADILVRKNRNGPTGDVALGFIRDTMRFTDKPTIHSIDIRKYVPAPKSDDDGPTDEEGD